MNIQNFIYCILNLCNGFANIRLAQTSVSRVHLLEVHSLGLMVRPKYSERLGVMRLQTGQKFITKNLNILVAKMSQINDFLEKHEPKITSRTKFCDPIK